MASRDDSVHSGRHDDEVKVLTTQVSFLEEEVAALRSRLADSPRQTHLLEQRLREAESNLAGHDARRLEDVLDELGLGARVPVDDAEVYASELDNGETVPPNTVVGGPYTAPDFE